MFTITPEHARFLRVLQRRAVPKGQQRPAQDRFLLTTDATGCWLHLPGDDLSISWCLTADQQETRVGWLPCQLLAHLAAQTAPSRPWEIHDTGVTIRWLGDQPKQHDVSWLNEPIPKPPRLPPTAVWQPIQPRFLTCLDEVSQAAAEANGRYALSRICIRGNTGQLIGSDGKQALIRGGWSFPFDGQLLLPAVSLFGLPLWKQAQRIEFSQTAHGIAIQMDSWIIQLHADAHGRYPDLDAIIQRHAGGSRLLVDPADGKQLMRDWPRSVPDVPVTIDLSARRIEYTDPSSKSISTTLLRSKTHGPMTRWCVSSRLWQRAIALGFREFSARIATETIVAQHGHDVMLLVQSADAATPDLQPKPMPERISPMAATPDPQPKPKPERISPMPVRAVTREHAPTEPIDPLAELESLRSSLADAMARVTKLMTSLKLFRRQRQAIETAMSSLQQLTPPS